MESRHVAIMMECLFLAKAVYFANIHHRAPFQNPPTTNIGLYLCEIFGCHERDVETSRH